MKQGRSLQELGRELTRQRNARKDFVADTRNLGLASDGRASVLTVSTGNDRQEFGVNELAHQQISARLAIPYRYYQKMQTEQPHLLDEYDILLDYFRPGELESYRKTYGNAVLKELYASTVGV